MRQSRLGMMDSMAQVLDAMQIFVSPGSGKFLVIYLAFDLNEAAPGNNFGVKIHLVTREIDSGFQYRHIRDALTARLPPNVVSQLDFDILSPVLSSQQ